MGFPLPKPAPYDFSESIDRRVNLAAFSSPEPTNTFIFGPEKNPKNTQSVDEEDAEKDLVLPNRKQSCSIDSSSPERSSKTFGSSTLLSDQVLFV